MRSPATQDFMDRVIRRVSVKRYDGREPDELAQAEREMLALEVEQVLQAVFREEGATLIIAPSNYPVIQIQEV